MAARSASTEARRFALRQILRSHQVLQSPMAGAQTHAMAVATYQAGGIGAIPCALLTLDQVKEEVKAFREKVNDVDAQLNLNFFCHTETAFNVDDTQKWLERLKPYYSKLGLTIPKADQLVETAKATARRAFDGEALQIVIALRPSIISFHFGLPKESLMVDLRKYLPETFIVSTATTLAEAEDLEKKGIDGIIVQGFEAGGHRGMFLESSGLESQVGLISLFGLVRKALGARLPLIAAGGICDDASARAALTLGADAVQVGSCLLNTTEALTSKLHRAALLDTPLRPTSLTNVFSGRPARGVVNQLMRDIKFVDTETVPRFPHASVALAPLRKAAEAQGDENFSPLWSGQSGLGPLGRELQSTTSIIRKLRAAL